MSFLSYCLVRSTRIGNVLGASIGKRSSPFLICKKELAASGSAHIDKHGVFTVQKRTLIKKRQLFGNSGSAHVKPDHKNDKVGPEFEFIFCSSNVKIYFWWTPMLLVLIFTILVLCGKVVVDEYWYGKKYEKIEMTRVSWMDSLDPMQSICFALVLTLGTLFSVILYLGTVLVRMYYNKSTNEFVAVMLKYGVYRKKVYFKASDVERIEKIQMKGNVKIKGIPAHVSEKNFTNTSAYNLFMGYSTSRSSELIGKLDIDDFGKVMKAMDEIVEKKNKEDFIEKYKEKRKQRGLKDR